MVPTARVTVVMAVYAKVQPDHLRAALSSLVAQTRPPDEVLVVGDGPLTAGLEQVLDDVADRLPIRRLDLPEQVGAGPARQAGLEAVTSTYVAIADADDISAPERIARQVELMERERLDLLGSAMVEFGDAVLEGQRRAAPVTAAAIGRRVRINNPFNHPTVMLRLSLALEVGGYRDLPFLEDYDLMTRMIAAGARVANSEDALVCYRMDEATLRRRTGWPVVRSELRLQRQMRQLGLVSRRRALGNLVVRNGYRVMPMAVRRTVNRRFLSRNGGPRATVH